MGSIETSIDAGIDYKLQRGGREAIRLTAQHHMLTARQGWLLHPDIAEAIKDIPQPQIADVATGTGAWALDVAQQMPHAHITGLDISDEQYPPAWTWPQNLDFGLYDLLEEAPAELQGKFDVVHVRLLLSAGPAVDKAVFINRFRTLLRPGGWLQWSDLTHPNMVAYKQSLKQGGLCEQIRLNHHPMIQVAVKHIRWDHTLAWFEHFEQVMAEYDGYDRAQRVQTPVRPHLLQMESDLCLAVMTSFIDVLISRQNVADILAIDELRAALAALYADADRGLLFSYNANVCIARRKFC